MSTSNGSTAANILTAALGHMRDRAATYDKPEGERSMGATVDAFTAVTGVCMTEEQGWLFMALLKAVRSQQGAYRADSYEDGAAYFALAGEAAVRDRNGGYDAAGIASCVLPDGFGKQNMIDPADVDIASEIDDDSERMPAIGQNGEMAAEVYAAVDGAPSWDDSPKWAKWLAQDEDGRWQWYSLKPTLDDECTDEFSPQRNDQWWLADSDECTISADARSGWRSSLQPRPIK